LYCIPIICYFCFTKLTFNQSWKSVLTLELI
jgi:hypothetical protein